MADLAKIVDDLSSLTVLEAAELAKYRAQLETYARIRRTLLPARTPIRLALYYPLLPRLIHWESFVAS